MNDSVSTAPRSRLRRFLVPLAVVIAILGVAGLSAFALQFSTYPVWHDRPPTEMWLSPIDTALIVVLIAAAWGILGRLSWSLGLVGAASVIVAGINYSKITLRREPVFPADRNFVSESGALLTMIDPGLVWTFGGAALGVLLLFPLLGLLVGRRIPGPRLWRRDSGWNRRVLVARIVTIGLAGALLLHATQFHQPRNFWRALYDRDAHWQPWSQVHNYRANGFVGGFLSNMPIGVMERPVGYGMDSMARVTEDYTALADQINADRHGSLADTNIIFVLAESFTDPSWLEGINLSDNPVPMTQEVMGQTIAGKMYALSYGGGTSTMEFETLTGQSVGLFNPQVSSPFPMFVADQVAYPSVVGAFAELGHRTSVIHSYHLDMYKRRQVYQALGFDQVIEQDDMLYRDRIDTSRYISDAAAFNEALLQLDSHPGPQFINLVTMQNHGPYPNSYLDPITPDSPLSKNPGDYGQYARGLAHTDEALAGFLTHLQARAEQTIVVFYGDHHPGVYTEEFVAEHGDETYATPFFVWNSTTNEAQTVDAIGPALFLPLVYEAADAPVTPYVALLDQVRRTVPVIQPARTLDAHGTPVDLAKLDDQTADLIEDLRLVQYDFSVGDRLALESMWPGAVVQRTN